MNVLRAGTGAPAGEDTSQMSSGPCKQDSDFSGKFLQESLRICEKGG